MWQPRCIGTTSAAGELAYSSGLVAWMTGGWLHDCSTSFGPSWHALTVPDKWLTFCVVRFQHGSLIFTKVVVNTYVLKQLT